MISYKKDGRKPTKGDMEKLKSAWIEKKKSGEKHLDLNKFLREAGRASNKG
jgi:hypothetical protein